MVCEQGVDAGDFGVAEVGVGDGLGEASEFAVYGVVYVADEEDCD